MVIIPTLNNTFDLSPFHSNNFSYFYLNLITNPIILEFLAGAIIAKIYLKEKLTIKNKTAAYACVAMAFAFVLWNNYSITGVLHGIKDWGLSLSILVLVLAITSKTIKIPASPLLVWLGKISFSLYITHLIIFNMALTHFNKNGYSSAPAAILYCVIFITLSLGFAALFQYLVEEKLSNWIKSLFKRKQQKTTQPITN